MRPEYRSLEGRLYGLGRPPEGRPVSPHPSRKVGSERFLGAQGTPPKEVIPRLDLSFAVARLPQVDAEVIRDHYITGLKPRRGVERKRAVDHLLDMLEDEARHS